MPYRTDFDRAVRQTHVGAHVRADLRPTAWLSFLGGARIDFFGFDVLDRNFAETDRIGERLPRSAFTAHGIAFSPRGSVSLRLHESLVWITAAGLGARSSDAAALSEAELAPFARVTALESGFVFDHTRDDLTLEARLSAFVGPVYLHAPPSTPLLAHLRAFFVSTAHAHAGDDNLDGVRVLGEVLDPLAFDALDDAGTSFGPMLAEASTLDRVVLVLDEPRGEHAIPTGPTHGHHAWVSGRAVRGDDEVRFSAGLDVIDDRIARRVEGVRFASPPTLVEGARVVVRSRPGRWLSRVDFDALLEADHEGEVPAPSQLHHAWYLALRDPSSWELALETP